MGSNEKKRQQNIESSDFGRLKELTEKYRDLPMDLLIRVWCILQNSVSTLLQLSIATSRFIVLMEERNSMLFSLKRQILKDLKKTT